jgi:hypothetical protein
MNRALLTLVACLFAVNTAVAQKEPVRVVEGAGEYLLSHVNLPAGGTGSLGLKPCATCSTQSLHVTAATQYHVNASQVAFADFAAVVAELRKANADEHTMVSLFIDRASHEVTRIYVYKPAQ